MPRVSRSAVGLKMTGNLRLSLGLINIGTGKSPNEKPLPFSDLEVIRSILSPVLVSSME
jgi:hypothetical protein